MTYSKSADQQDLWVATNTNFKRNGYFVEMGAGDGVTLSNTYFLEKFLRWTGILAEPAVRYHNVLPQNRPNSSIEFDCVWSTTGETKKFYEAVYNDDFRSTLEDCANRWATISRKEWPSYDVKTISLLDLLDKHNAPKYIDYLSLDTEGSELDILQGFDFSKYTFGYISVEHNLRLIYREKLKKVLNENGYYVPKNWVNIFKWDDAYYYQGN